MPRNSGRADTTADESRCSPLDAWRIYGARGRGPERAALPPRALAGRGRWHPVGVSLHLVVSLLRARPRGCHRRSGRGIGGGLAIRDHLKLLGDDSRFEEEFARPLSLAAYLTGIEGAGSAPVADRPRSKVWPSAATVTGKSGRTSVTAASMASSSAASSRPGSWWNATRCRAPTRWAKASAWSTVLWPQPTCRGYSARVYCASCSSRSTFSASSKPEVHSASRGNLRAPSAGSWSGRYVSEARSVSIR